ncbi:hypothetical protein [Bacillus sp. NPDC094106]|uniref:hypothetical protein n=1 Tax=Bacillus sp. NPDC094106 TaxID=3363949 RepID=UPI0038068DDC
MKNLMNRAKYVLNGEDGASNVEIIVWISVVLVLATALFIFKDKIVDFLTRAGGTVDKLQVN